jgi:maltooligosyltrehalose trehalohydrolase
MTIFRVWAPKANTMAVQMGGQEVPMNRCGMEGSPRNGMSTRAREAQGWWQVEIEEAGPGTDYAFILDGGTPLPDPRSPWQPQGVHGPSRIIDPATFAWTDRGWRAGPLASAVIYELHIGTFTPEGTFESAISRLNHLVDLGITHVELMPVNEFPGNRGWGYDGVGLYAPHHAYGEPEGLCHLVDACHARGLAVILDVVYNHLGPDGNYLSIFGPYFTDRYTTPWGEAINFDGPGSDEVRRFFIDNALMWLRDYHIDALRLDAVHAIIDTSAVHFLEELARAVQALSIELNRPLALIAEDNRNDPRPVRSPEAGGFGLDAQWSDDFHHALHTLLTGEEKGYYADYGAWEHLAQALKRVFVYRGQSYSPARGRHYGRPVIGLPGYRFVGCVQNHDQIGNRAQGGRLGALVNTAQLKVAAALLLTGPQIPLLFQGEEWAASSPFLYFTDHQDPKLAEAVRTGRRKEFAAFGWDPEEIPDPQAEETFQQSKLDWHEREQGAHAGLLNWYRRLIALRRDTPALLDGDIDRLQVTYDADKHWLILDRRPIMVVCNLAEAPQDIQVSEDLPLRVLLASEDRATLTAHTASLPPEAILILEEVS